MSGVPSRMQTCIEGRVAVDTLMRHDCDVDLVTAVSILNRMQRLVEIANEVNKEF